MSKKALSRKVERRVGLGDDNHRTTVTYYPDHIQVARWTRWQGARDWRAITERHIDAEPGEIAHLAEESVRSPGWDVAWRVTYRGAVIR